MRQLSRSKAAVKLFSPAALALAVGLMCWGSAATAGDPLPLSDTHITSRTAAIPVLPTFSCVVKVGGVVKETYKAVNRTECYHKTSFGSANCSFYKNKGYFPVAGTTYFLEQYFNGTDLVNSQYCHWAG